MNDRAKVYEYLATCQAFVTMSTAMVDETGHVHHDTVVVREAPPRVVRELIEQFTLVSLRPCGLVIPVE